MEKLIERLKKARQEQNITLKEISEKTKIHTRLLESIEKGDFSPFDGEVYIIGALKNYAEMVGLDPQEIVDSYKQIREEEQTSNDKTPKKANKRVTKSKPPFPYAVTIALILLIAIVSVAIWISVTGEEVATNDDENDNGIIEDETDTENDNNAESIIPEPEENDDETVVQVNEVESTGAESFWEVEGVDYLEIELILQNDCWIRAYADGENVLDATYQAGEELELEATEEIYMHVGLTPAIDMKVNQQELEAITDHDDVHEYHFHLK